MAAPRWRRSRGRAALAALAAAAAAAAAGAAAFAAGGRGSWRSAPRLPTQGVGLSGASPASQPSLAAPLAGSAGARASTGGLCAAALALGLALRAVQRALPRTSAGAGSRGDAVESGADGAELGSSLHEQKFPVVGATIAAATLLAVAGGGHPAYAAETFDLDIFNPWESVVNINAKLIIGIDSLVGSVGVALLLYTVFAKVITYPIYQTSLRTSAIMRIISPQVKQIQKQYQSDEALRNKMVQAMYQKVGVNPIDGLLPVFAQLPVFLALFYAIKKLALSDEHFKEPFLWIPSLAGPAEAGSPSLDWLIKSASADHFEPLVGWQNAGLYLILPVLLLATQLTLAKVQASPKDPDFISLFFPFIVGLSTLVSPQGLGIYWLTNSLLTAGQTFYMRGQIAEEFPDFKTTFEETGGAPDDDIEKGDKVLFQGREGTVIYGPDTDGDCKLKFEDGTESDYLKAYQLRRPGKLDDSIAEVAEEATPAEAPKLTRRQMKAAKAKEKKRRRAAADRAKA